ncbi:MAG: hypothetical protein MMC23_002498 [Stictis urceolatum]|nr:hypothetical protein [Stictis urceolata]
MKHHLLIGTWTPPGVVFTVAFDDEALTLELVERNPIPEHEPISWLTISHDKKTLYGASMKNFSSHSITSPTDITPAASHPIGGDPSAQLASTNTRAIFILAAQRPPYTVYGAPFYNHAGYGNVFSIDDSGRLDKNIQNYELDPKAGVHGMVFDSSESYLYSADMHANCIWTHLKDPSTGTLALVSRTPAPAEGDQPRWVAMHPSGRYLYACMEKGNRLAEYLIDPESHRPVFTHHTWPLSPPCLPPAPHFRGDVVFPSSSGKFLFASTRNSKKGVPGYLSVYALKESGAVDGQVQLVPTCTSGGHSNAVSPCPWSDEWVAVTDDEVGGVEVWRWDGRGNWFGRVARLEVREPGFGMNAVWYD